MESDNKIVAICIATFKRPDLLKNCLTSIGQISIPDSYAPIIIVVDNDHEQTGEKSFSETIKAINFNAYYYVEATRGLSSVRNRLLEKAFEHNANFIAFIDDDELAHKEWLVNMTNGFNKYSCDIVTGPVVSIAGIVPPDSFSINSKRITGSIPRTISTNNVIFNAKPIKESCLRFDRYFDFIGGEDFDFFDRAKKIGMTSIWLNEAIIFETIVHERSTIKYIIYRHFTGGINAVMRYRRHHSLLYAWGKYLPKILGKILGALAALVTSLFYEHKKNFNKFIIKTSNGVGYLCGLTNIIVERYKY